MSAPGEEGSTIEAARALGDEESFRLLAQLVALAPTNLEDPGHSRWEKPNYLRASEAIVRAARAAGLSTRIYDPMIEGDVPGDWHGLARPNVIGELDRGARETVLVMAHYDVVPVPKEQEPRWRSPPHTLTLRKDGRLYGRGSNDDLGSGVVASLAAIRRLVASDDAPRNVRFLACCDEETGGEGGIEAIRAHDEHLPAGDRRRILLADVALIPDGSPETTAGSSGVAFMDASFSKPVPLSEGLAYGDALVGLHEVARGWRSVYASPDWPQRHAPEPVITGRATVTQFDVTGVPAEAGRVRLVAAHAESDAANQVPRTVTIAFAGPSEELDALPARLSPLLAPPFRLEAAGSTSLRVPPGARALQVVGEATHGGYPHRGHNPVPATLGLLRAAADRGLVDPRAPATTTFAVDLRLIPEMELSVGLAAALGYVESWGKTHAPAARISAPPARCRSGYALPIEHPATQKLARILEATVGVKGIYGEYGGTDASALRGLRTPKGEPLPALVFGSMDPESHIHDAEESADPHKIAAIARTIERFVREP